MEIQVPQIGQESVDEIFQGLSQMEVHLDDNPLQFGPRRLNSKIAHARGMLTDCEGIYLKVCHWVQMYRAAHRAASVSLDLGKKNLLTNDPEVRAGRNLADRDAIASMKLRDEVEKVSHLESVLDDLDTLVTVIKAKRSDLRDVQGRLRDQMRLCQEEIGLGGRWGSKVPPGVEVNLDGGDSPEERTTLRQLQDMFSSPDKPQDIVEHVPVDETMADLLDSSVANDDGADDFLDAIEIRPRESDLDVDTLLKDFDL